MFLVAFLLTSSAAGQAYEKKAKKKDRDAADEHSRYVAILNAVGPEMSQDK